MRHFTALKVQRNFESIDAIEQQIAIFKVAIAGMEPRYWHRKKMLRAHIKRLRGYVRALNREIELAS